MAFPTVAANNNSQSASGTSHAVSLPASIASGDRLVVLIGAPGNVTFTSPAGWNERVDSGGANGTIYVSERVADGSEGATATFTSSGNTTSAHLSYRITGAHASQAIEAGTVTAVTGGTSFNSTSVTPSWGADDNLFIVALGLRNADRTVSSYPANYTGNQLSRFHSGGGNSGGAVLCTRNLNATTDDPGALTMSGGADGRIVTLVLRPAAVGGVVTRSYGFIIG